MLYEVITNFPGRVMMLALALVVFLVAIGNAADTKTSKASKSAKKQSRITSYNVCYTKLLRIIAQRGGSYSGLTVIDQSGMRGLWKEGFFNYVRSKGLLIMKGESV